MEIKKSQKESSSEFHQEILGQMPHWTLRYGIFITGIFIMLLLLGSAVFQYPDTISASMILTASNPPTPIISKVSGRLEKIYVNNNQRVNAGEDLAVIENPAHINDVKYLKNYLESITQFTDTIIPLPINNLRLGDIQSLFTTLYTVISEYNEFIKSKYYKKKINLTRKKIEQYRNYQNGLFKQIEIVKQQNLVAEIQYKRELNLHQEGVISDDDIENAIKMILENKLSLESMNSELDNTKISTTTMELSLMESENQYNDNVNKFQTQLKSCIAQIISEIERWNLNYKIVSPINGEIFFTNHWKENQNISKGDVAFIVIPYYEGELIGRAFMEMNHSGNVKSGQEVNIRFLNFVDSQYGIVKGIVKGVSPVPIKTDISNNLLYLIEIGLPNGLNTNYGKTLPYLPEMQADIEIITENLTILQRIFMPLRKILKEGIKE